MNLINIVINDQAQQVEAQSSLEDIISQFSLPNLGCVFSINNQVISRDKWSSTLLSEGDAISLFQAIAGG
ncbi:sulfur carrier protein ThiS [Vibrio astriarenae]|uniref:Sulfur carrier protein ThiS n=1 Tax=Vibrio astriarenae TaxID=1481923 RepID=A0A7Z2T5D0_9VIBR|nr:sulfur carrier protein ThiS [Vibrio astriarenae]QIA64617.1 sulfur carrier protein ThiS [Vibrio astriarenae]GAL12775.1 sulfur carrier protein ThiS [Vibrio sp. C7]